MVNFNWCLVVFISEMSGASSAASSSLNSPASDGKLLSSVMGAVNRLKKTPVGSHSPVNHRDIFGSDTGKCFIFIRTF